MKLKNTLSRLTLVWIGVVFSSCAFAGDFVVGAGPTDFDDIDVAIIELEYHTDPIWEVAGADISIAGTLIGSDNGDFFVGAGVSAVRPFSKNWFIEASFMPGYFDNADEETDLGNDLEFRSLIGIGRTLSNGIGVSLAISHKSNASLGSSNPGVNALTLRFRF